MNEYNEEFVTDPVVIGKKMTLLMAVILAVLVVAMFINGDPLPESKFAMRGFKTAGSVVVFLTVIVAVVVGLAWFVLLASQPLTTTRIDDLGISINVQPYLFGEPRSNFIPWADIDVVRHIAASRGGDSLRAVVRGEEIVLMSRYMGNGKQFERLKTILESKTGVV
jgi:hypothetical protein